MAVPTSGLVYLDTAPAIYSVETHPRYSPMLVPLWLAVRTGQAVVVISDLGLLEALVGAFRQADEELAATYRALREEGEVRFVAIGTDVVERAALARARHPRLRTPDSIHFATAGLAGCDAFVTNDKALRSIPSMPVIVLDDLI